MVHCKTRAILAETAKLTSLQDKRSLRIQSPQHNPTPEITPPLAKDRLKQMPTLLSNSTVRNRPTSIRKNSGRLLTILQWIRPKAANPFHIPLNHHISRYLLSNRARPTTHLLSTPGTKLQRPNMASNHNSKIHIQS
jgi:hypothetical protein